MKKTLLLFAHPAFEKSVANAALLGGVEDLPNLTIHDLYSVYPDSLIQVDREQELLMEHDRVVLQYPFFWYSSPAIIKEWFDLVLEYGWAYGEQGNQLSGKTLLTAVTTGGSKDAYCKDGHNCYSVREFLRPVEQTARLCKMEFEDPFVVYSSLTQSEEALEKAAADYRTLLSAE